VGETREIGAEGGGGGVSFYATTTSVFFSTIFLIFSKTLTFLQDIEIEIVGEKLKTMAATQRLSSVLAHLNPSSSEAGGRAKLLQKNPDDIVPAFSPVYLISLQKTNTTR
jgi:hypothetical protein